MKKSALILNRTKKKKEKKNAKKPYTSNFETVCQIKSTTMFSREVLKTK